MAHSYVASSEGVVDGSDKAEYQVMVDAENSDNQLIAGAGGSSLWGGFGGNANVGFRVAGVTYAENRSDGS